MTKTVEYFNGDTMAADVWENKYKYGEEQTPDDMHRRLAKEFYKAQWYNPPKESNTKLSEYGYKRNAYLSEEEIYNLFKNFSQIIPQGSIMSQLGNKDSIGSLSNCFVIGQPLDSYGGIMYKEEEMVQLMKRRGGVGIDLSTLRPRGTNVKNAAKSSTGMASFMHRYSNGTREVAQDGRRGALMLSVNINHPDSLEFIEMKQDPTKVTGANVSVLITNEFMEAAMNDEDYILRFPVDLELTTEEMLDLVPYCNYGELHPLLDGRGYVKKIRSKEYWDKIIECAWNSAEPGILFLDNHHDYSPDGVYDDMKMVTTNPCGEIGMGPYDACRLIALNLLGVVDNPFTEKSKLNIDKLYKLAYEQQWLGDLLVDLEINYINRIIAKLEKDSEPEEVKATEIRLWLDIRNTAEKSRRTGNGITALGDMIAALGHKYDSDEALNIIELVFFTMQMAQLDATIDLAKLKGPFPGWDPELEDEGNAWFKMVKETFGHRYEEMMKYGRRNVSFSTIAPTGTVSIMSQTTSGMEPLFKPWYIRRKKINPNDEGARVDFTDELGDTWQEYPVLHPMLKAWIYAQYDAPITLGGIDEMSVDEVTEWYQKSPWYGATAEEINWKRRTEIQGVIQKYITHSISSTINLPNDVSKEEVATIYETAWKAGLKGVTVYRDGCRSGVLVTKSSQEEDDLTPQDAVRRPKKVEAIAYHVTALGDPWTVYIGFLKGKPYEVFVSPGEQAKHKQNGFIEKQTRGVYSFVVGDDIIVENIVSELSDEQAGMTRMISMALRHRVDLKYVIDQLNSTPGTIVSFSKAIARTLKRHLEGDIKATCQECGSPDVIMAEGCLTCKACGSSKCA